MAIPQSFIDELLARIDIVDIIEQRLPLRKRGTNYIACCPFHNEKTPSFTVSQTKQIYHCFGCGVGGNIISFIMNYERLSFTETIEQLASTAGIPVPQDESKPQLKKANPTNLYELLDKVARFYLQQLRQHPEGQQAIAYLKQRGLTGAIAKNFGIGYAPNTWDSLVLAFPHQQENLYACGMLIKKDNGNYCDRFRGRIMFPILNQRGQVVGFGGRIIEKGEPKYLNSPETPLFHKGTELYGFYEAHATHRHLARLLIVEGYLDVIALAQYGITYAVATLGTATTAAHLKKLFRYTNELIFCFDGDAAGQAAAWKALEAALPFMEDGRQIRFLLLPQGHDPDTYIREVNTQVFAERVATATTLEDFLFTRLTDNVDLDSPAGKAQLVKAIGERLSLLPKSSFQHILLEQLAKLLKVNISTLQRMLQNSIKPAKIETRIEAVESNNRVSFNTPSLVRYAIAILLQYPRMITQLETVPSFNASNSKGLTFLTELITLIRNNPQLTTGALLEHWREHNYNKQLRTLATRPLNGTEQDLLIELQATLNRLTEEQQLQTLWEQYRQGALNQADKSRLFQLLQTQKKAI